MSSAGLCSGRLCECHRDRFSMYILQRKLVASTKTWTRYLLPSTSKAYRQWAVVKNDQPRTDAVQLKDGATGHWVGDPNAKNVFIYYHGTSSHCIITLNPKPNRITTGGGFAIPGSAGHFKFYSKLLNSVNNKSSTTVDNKAAIFFLSYTLTPHAVYPTQLGQAVDALRYILKDTKRSPSNVFLGGDSAGGNMAFSVLAHLSHPHPDIVPLPLTSSSSTDTDSDDARLAGVFAIAPWVSSSTDPSRFPSMRTNSCRDIVTRDEIATWAADYTRNSRSSTRRNPGVPDPWHELIASPTGWWSDARAKQLLVTVGEDEILLSSIEQFVDKIQGDFAAADRDPKDLELVIGEGEAHVPMVYVEDEDTQQAIELDRWLSDRLASLS